MSELWIFLGALAVAYLVPGPDMVLVLETATRRGRAHALATAAGLAAARGTHVALAALGLAALLQGAPAVFEAVRLVGAAYLVWLGIGIARAPVATPGGAAPATNGRRPSLRGSLVRGLLTNITNPKALMFCSVLLPQFVQPDGGAVAGQFAALGVILVATGIAFDLVYAFAGATLGDWTRRRSGVQFLRRWGFAALLIGFGLRLAFADRPQ